MKPSHSVKTCLVALALLFTAPAFAVPIVLDHVDRGWYGAGGGSNALNTNYVVGTAGPWRNFFVFDLSGVTDPILSAELRLDNLNLEGHAGTYTMWDVDNGNIANLFAASGGVSVYNDLGTGTQYASQALTADLGTKVISLNAAAIAALSSATGNFAFGGNYTGQYMFAGTHLTIPGTSQRPRTVLVLNPDSANDIPSPGPLALLGLGLVAFRMNRRVS